MECHTAQAIETLFGGQLENHLSELAYHYSVIAAAAARGRRQIALCDEHGLTATLLQSRSNQSVP